MAMPSWPRITSLAIRLDPSTSLGPMVRASAADFARGQVDEAVAQGARSLIDPGRFRARSAGRPIWRRNAW